MSGGVCDAHWTQAAERRADSEASETHLSNGGVDDPLLAELVKETLGDLE